MASPLNGSAPLKVYSKILVSRSSLGNKVSPVNGSISGITASLGNLKSQQGDTGLAIF
jgi:hypothetical protein